MTKQFAQSDLWQVRVEMNASQTAQSIITLIESCNIPWHHIHTW